MLVGLCRQVVTKVVHIIYTGSVASHVKIDSSTKPFRASTNIAAAYSGCSNTATLGIGIIQISESLHMLAMMRYTQHHTVHDNRVCVQTECQYYICLS